MKRCIHVCRPEDSLNAAAQLMWNHECGSVIVVDGDGRAISMVTDRDICMAAYTQGRCLAEIPVSVAASRRIITAREGASLDEIERLMAHHRVRRIPIVDGYGHAIGLVSMDDIMRHAYAGARDEALSPASVTGTLVEVCRPSSLPPEPYYAESRP
jgi:CBS domain-containing protein